MGAEERTLARDGFSGPGIIIDGKEEALACSKNGNTRDSQHIDGKALVGGTCPFTEISRPHSDCGMRGSTIEALSHDAHPPCDEVINGEGNKIKVTNVKELKVE